MTRVHLFSSFIIQALAVALAALLPAQARAEVTGMVYELLNPEAPRAEWRRQPLAGAYVTVTWTVSIPAPGHSTSSCRYAEIARTDARGRYSVEGPNFITAGVARVNAMAHAPGRDRIPFPYPGSEMKVRDVTMAKSTSPPERRLITLSILADAGCFHETATHDPHGLVKPYLESLLAEARALKVDTPEGRNALSALAAKVKYSDPANLAPQPIKPVPMEVDRRELRQANPLPAVPAAQ